MTRLARCIHCPKRSMVMAQPGLASCSAPDIIARGSRTRERMTPRAFLSSPRLRVTNASSPPKSDLTQFLFIQKSKRANALFILGPRKRIRSPVRHFDAMRPEPTAGAPPEGTHGYTWHPDGGSPQQRPDGSKRVSLPLRRERGDRERTHERGVALAAMGKLRTNSAYLEGRSELFANVWQRGGRWCAGIQCFFAFR